MCPRVRLSEWDSMVVGMYYSTSTKTPFITVSEEFEDTKGKGVINPYRRTKVQTDKQRSTKHTHKTEDRVTRTPLKTGVNSGALEEGILFLLY